ncbi:MAG: hypothetical protein ACQEP4_00895 [Bacillota bacterium]
MKRNGYVTLLVVIVSAVCITTAIFVCETILIQSRLQRNRRDNIQARLSLESEIINMLYQKNEIPEITLGILKGPKAYVFQKLEIPVQIQDFQNAKGEFQLDECPDKRLTYRLTIQGDMMNVRDDIEARGHVYNPAIDHCMDGFVSLQGKSLDDSARVQNLLDGIKKDLDRDNLPSDYYLASNILSNNINIRAKTIGYSEIAYVREFGNIEESFSYGKIMLLKEYDGYNRDIVRIESHPDNTYPGILKGIVFIEEGDLVLSGNLNIIGIVILGDGTLIKEGEGDITISGKLILNNYQELPETIRTEYHDEGFRQTAVYLPGFVIPGIDSIR